MSTSAITAQGSTVQISSTSGAAKNISNIAVGSPTILTSSAHGLVKGDIVALAGFTGADAGLLNSQSAVITNVTTNTFAVGIDTTGKTIDNAGPGAIGTATPAAWTTVGGCKSFKPGEPTVDDIESTDLASTVKEFRPGLADYKDLTLEMMYINGDLGQAAIAASFASKATKSIKITIPSGEAFTFTGYINKCGLPDGAVSAISNFSASLKVTQAVTRA